MYRGHGTISPSANQTIQFVRAFGPDVTQVYSGLFEDVFVRSRGVSNLGLLGRPGRSPFPSAFVSTLVESVASQSPNSLPTSTGVSFTSRNGAGIELRQMPVFEPRISQMISIAKISVPGKRKRILFIFADYLVREADPGSRMSGQRGRMSVYGGIASVVPWAEKGPQDPLHNRYNFFCTVYWAIVSMGAREVY